MGGPGKCGGKIVTAVDNFLPTKFVVNGIIPSSVLSFLHPPSFTSSSFSIASNVGVEFCSAENYFQALKCTTKEEFEKVRRGGCGADVRYPLLMQFTTPSHSPILNLPSSSVYLLLPLPFPFPVSIFPSLSHSSSPHFIYLPFSSLKSFPLGLDGGVNGELEEGLGGSESSRYV